MKRKVAGLLPLFFVVASASHACAIPSCKSSSCYYQVKEGLVYQGQTLIQFGTTQQDAILAHPVLLTIHVGRTAYCLVYKIADNVITRSGHKAVAVNFGIAQYLGHHWTVIGKPSMELLDGKTGNMGLQRVDPRGKLITWHIVFQAIPLARYKVLQLLQKARKPVDPKLYLGIPINESMSTLLTSATPSRCCRTPCNPGPGDLTCCGAIACSDTASAVSLLNSDVRLP